MAAEGSGDASLPRHRRSTWQPPRCSSTPALPSAAAAADRSPSSIASLQSAGDVDAPNGSSLLLSASSCSRALVGRRGRVSWTLDGTLPDRSSHSCEHYKDECLRLKTELTDRREETKQLQQRVKLLEGSLQARMHQVETLVEEFRLIGSGPAAVGGDRRNVELLDRIIQEARRTQVVLHVHADSGAHLEAKDKLLEEAQKDRERQDTLKEQLADSQQEAKRLASKAKGNEQSAGLLKQQLTQAKRAARRQEEHLGDYERQHRELHERLGSVAGQLEDERRGRRDQERQARRMAALFDEAKTEIAQLNELRDRPSARGRARDSLGGLSARGGRSATASRASSAPGPPLPFAASAASVASEDGVDLWASAGSSLLRVEHELSRDEERAQRRRRRARQAVAEDGFSNAAPDRPEGLDIRDRAASPDDCGEERGSAPEALDTCSVLAAALRCVRPPPQPSLSLPTVPGSAARGDPPELAAPQDAALREECARLELRCAELSEHHALECAQLRREHLEERALREAVAEVQDSETWAARASERFARLECSEFEQRWADSEALAGQLLRAEDDLRGVAEMGESRAWLLTEVANEVAWQADLRHLGVLQDELAMQRSAGASELRCSLLAAVANQAASKSF